MEWKETTVEHRGWKISAHVAGDTQKFVKGARAAIDWWVDLGPSEYNEEAELAIFNKMGTFFAGSVDDLKLY